MVSIMVTMLMMLVISLIVLGFAQVSRREQRQSLDRQLSAQAFFAAESGVNDARQAIMQQVQAGTPIQEKTDCPTSPLTTPYAFNSVLDSSNNVSYTCLLVTTKLNNINVAVSDSGDSVNIPVQPSGGTATKLHINWQPKTVPTAADVANCKNGVPATASFPRAAAGGWTCPYGVLRVDFVPTDTLSRAALTGNQKTVFFYPTQGVPATPVDFATANGTVAGMRCTVATGCDVDVTNLPAGTQTYALRLSAVYASGTFDLRAKDAGGVDLELKNAQIQVDATGKAQDVLRRIQVRLAMAPSGKTPDFAIESGSSICKRFTINSNTFTIPNDIKGQDPNNPMCQPSVYEPVCTITPRDIVMVLDISGSMNDRWQTTNKIDKLVEVSNYLVVNSSIADQANHMAVVQFNSDAQLVQSLTSDIPSLQTAVNGLRARSNTAYTAALTMAQQALVPARPTAGKVIIFISDGFPTDDPNQAVALSTTLKAQGTSIYTIAVELDQEGYPLLQSMAGNGGTFIPAEEESQLEQAIADIAAGFQCQ